MEIYGFDHTQATTIKKAVAVPIFKPKRMLCQLRHLIFESMSERGTTRIRNSIANPT
jgi:hypothetical protein